MWQIGCMSSGAVAADVWRRGGWLPDSQEDLEFWLTGHRERVEAKGSQTSLHPVLVEFRELIDTDPLVCMYLERMVAEVPRNRNYRKRHLTSVEQLLRLINEVLTIAPEFGDQAVTLPLGAILDWTMGTSAGFAAYRDPRVNAMLKKILTAWCEFLDSGDSRYVLNDSPTGWKSQAAREAIGIDQYEHDPKDEHWGSPPGTTSSPDASSPACGRWPHRRMTRSSSARASRRPTVSAPTCSAVIASGSRVSRTHCRTCWPTTSRLRSLSAAPVRAEKLIHPLQPPVSAPSATLG